MRHSGSPRRGIVLDSLTRRGERGRTFRGNVALFLGDFAKDVAFACEPLRKTLGIKVSMGQLEGDTRSVSSSVRRARHTVFMPPCPILWRQIGLSPTGR
jgi:hypothetical protein